MNISLNIICKADLAEEKAAMVKTLLSLLGIDDTLCFEPYWKDNGLSQLLFGASLEKPDFALVKAVLSAIVGAEVALSASMEEWEFSYYATVDELLSGKKSAFLVCDIY